MNPVDQSNAMFALLRSHGIEPVAFNHYVPSSGDDRNNLEEATSEAESFCGWEGGIKQSHTNDSVPLEEGVN